jgi:hypothetical protein
MNHNGKSRDELAREANEVRSKLMRTVEQLDRRRHQAVDVRLQMKRHLRQLVVAGAVLVVLTAGTVALLVNRVATATERRRRHRWTLAKDVWRHPERAIRRERRPFLSELARAVLLSAASALLAIPVRRAAGIVERALPAKR